MVSVAALTIAVGSNRNLLNEIFVFLPSEVPIVEVEKALESQSSAEWVEDSLTAAVALPLVGDSIPPVEDREGDFLTSPQNNPFDLKDPAAIQQQVEYDPTTGNYIITETINGMPYRAPTYMTFDEYWDWKQQQVQDNYWEQKNDSRSLLGAGAGGGGGLGGLLSPSLYSGSELVESIFGNDFIEIRPTGSLTLGLGARQNFTDNPNLPADQRRIQKQWRFNFEQPDINVGVQAKIGNKLLANLNYNTRSVFNFDNQIKLEYTGNEDEIIQEIRAGNINFPLPTTLIPGSQALFGLQTKLKFGRLTINAVASQQQSRPRSITLEKGAQKQTFRIDADQYDENRHFFISQYFAQNYDNFLSSLPYVKSPITITRLDVYVSDTRGTADDVQRDVVALADLGEESIFHNPNIIPTGVSLPDNKANNLYLKLYSNPQARVIDQAFDVLTNPAGTFKLRDVRDFKKIQVRKLDPDEYIYDPQLGFVSLNFALRSNEVLAVAFEYTTTNGDRFKVGEFAEEIFSVTNNQDPRVLYLKMLKTTTQITTQPLWDLMMKNVYALGGYQINSQDFRLDVYYENPGNGDIRYIPEGTNVRGIPIIQLINSDRLNRVQEPYSDGIFDFIEARRDFSGGTGAQQQSNFANNTINNTLQQGQNTTANQQQANAVRYGTVNMRNGRVIFPVREPFGSHLRSKFVEAEEAIAKKYVYQQLYDSTRTRALEFSELNRYVIKGEYKADISADISLGAFNIPPGSVRVTAGAQELIENVDYLIDYDLGRLTILNEAYVNAGLPLNIAFEDNATFGINRRTYLGARLDYRVSKDFNIGGTVVRLSERPITQKVNYGDQPIANAMVGMDVNYFKEAPGLTRLLDKLPLYSTKEPSSIRFYAEGAGFLPGHHRAIRQNDGTIYIDDFEGTNTDFDLKMPNQEWIMASTPRGMQGRNGELLFPESGLTDSLVYGYNRAKIAWYFLDNVVLGRSGLNTTVPEELSNANTLSNQYTRVIPQLEVFPNLQVQTGQSGILRTFDVAYYPEERGSYNFDTKPFSLGGINISSGIDEEGRLKNPKTRWGGLMRNISTNKDFEASNVEYVEFWMLDPFIYAKPNDYEAYDGDMYIHLGNVSEDVMKDSRQFFENGLPEPTDVANLDTTRWGVVPKIRPIVPAFANTEEARKAQDVGWDGLPDTKEAQQFANYLDKLQDMVASGELGQEVYEQILEDPSNDDFRYFLDERYNDIIYPTTDPEKAGQNLLERYKRYNNSEGNSPIQQNISTVYNVGGATQPEIEDMNDDQALADSEAFFEYRLRLHPDMDIGESYIVDKYVADAELKNGTTEQATWYYFRVPISQFTNKVGEVTFRNIEFIRLVMTRFAKPVVMRFARFNLVRNNWRRYPYLIREEGEYFPANTDNTTDSFFDQYTLSTDRNSDREPIPYMIPPGITREMQPTTIQTLFQNEQSVSVRVGDLQDGESKAIYKFADLDMRAFKRLRLFTHAEQLNTNIISCADNTLSDGDVTAFIRIGDDFQNNYYEYEIPLKLTVLDDKPDDDDPQLILRDPEHPIRKWVWPNQNEFNIRLQDLVDAKMERNFKDNGNSLPKNKPYIKYIKDHFMVLASGDTVYAKIKVVGSPDIGQTKQVMLGVRNPKRNAINKDYDTGESKCAEVWFNELRLTEFDESAGWAALARMDMKLADLGNLVVSSNMHTAGFGTLEQRLNERKLDNYIDYNAALNLELGKFLPKSLGVRIPMYASASESFSNPKYDPYDTDVLQKRNIDSISLYHGADSARIARKQRQTYNSVKSVNFSNVRKERSNTAKAPMPYDIENLSLTYAYTETKRIDPIIELERNREHKGSLGYNYNARPIYWTPFNKMIKSGSLYLRLLKDFNINLIPSTVTLRTDMARNVGDITLRDIPKALDIPSYTYYNKFFSWDRYYGLKYNPAKSITIDFNAAHRSVIDEPQIGITPKDTIWQGIRRLGRPRSYEQQTTVGYNLPLDKFPLLSWVQVRTSYGSGYFWRANPLQMADTLGNVIGNTQNVQVNGELDFTRIYNAIPFLRKINGLRPKSGAKKKSNDKNAQEPPKGNATKVASSDMSLIAKIILRPLLSVRRVSATYNRKSGTTLPGFLPRAKYFGMNFAGDPSPMPGWDFAFGYQPNVKSWAEWIAEQGVVSQSMWQNQQVQQSRNNDMDLQVNLEPFPDLKINLNAKLAHTRNHTELYKVDNTNTNYRHLAKIDIGSYNITYLTWNTVFGKVDTQKISYAFRDFEKNRKVISERLNQLNPASVDGQEFYNLLDSVDVSGYFDGYGPYSQDVLLPAFVAAYSGKTPDKVNLNVLNLIPKPNWRINYNGLAKLPRISTVLSTLNITHSYSSTLTVNNYRNNLDFEDRYYNQDMVLTNANSWVDYLTNERILMAQTGDIDTVTGNFSSYYQVPQIVINEQLAPLIGIDMSWKSGVTSRFEYKKSRILMMSFQDYQLSETKSDEFTIGAGYRLTGLKMPFKFRGKPLELNNELTFNFDFSYRNNITFIYRLDQNFSEPTRGMKMIRLSPTIDYVVSNRIRLSLYYEYQKSIPATSASFPTTNQAAGIRLNLSLAE